jgi:hypothetical protein
MLASECAFDEEDEDDGAGTAGEEDEGGAIAAETSALEGLGANTGGVVEGFGGCSASGVMVDVGSDRGSNLVVVLVVVGVVVQRS